MKLAKILIVTIVMSVVFTLSIDARYRYSSKVEQSVPKYPDRSHIYPGECVDTLIRLKNEGKSELPIPIINVVGIPTREKLEETLNKVAKSMN